MKTLEETIETIRNNKRITKEEVKLLYAELQLQCMRNNQLEKENKELKSKVEFQIRNREKLEDASGMYVSTGGLLIKRR